MAVREVRGTSPIRGTIKVSQEIIDQIQNMGKEAAVKRAQQPGASSEFREGVRRIYPGTDIRGGSSASPGTKAGKARRAAAGIGEKTPPKAAISRRMKKAEGIKRVGKSAPEEKETSSGGRRRFQPVGGIPDLSENVGRLRDWHKGKQAWWEKATKEEKEKASAAWRRLQKGKGRSRLGI